MNDKDGFEKPAVIDYGSLTDLTTALEGCNAEDGGAKNTKQHHTDPCN